MIRTPIQLPATPDPGTDAGRLDGGAVENPFRVVPRVLDLVRLTGAIFFRSEFRSPWAYTSPPAVELEGAVPSSPGSLVMFHIVAEGSCWVKLGDGVRHELSRGDVVVMPYGDANAWGSFEPADPVSIATLLPPPPWATLPHIVYGGEGPETKVVCGYLRGDAILFDPVLRALPPLFVVHPPDGPAAAWVNASVEYAMTDPSLLRATASPTSRTDQRLAESVFTEVLRLYLEDRRDARLTGWLAAMRDPIVGPALARLHEDPAHGWTVAGLAAAVATSRTVLTEGFVRLLGMPPIRYLTEWRLNLASGLLRSTDQTVGEIALAVGYASEPAFSRAFKRAFGRAPAHWRAERT
jgi:AraC-like DNA-binding protein